MDKLAHRQITRWKDKMAHKQTDGRIAKYIRTIRYSLPLVYLFMIKMDNKIYRCIWLVTIYRVRKGVGGYREALLSLPVTACFLPVWLCSKSQLYASSSLSKNKSKFLENFTLFAYYLLSNHLFISFTYLGILVLTGWSQIGCHKGLKRQKMHTLLFSILRWDAFSIMILCFNNGFKRLMDSSNYLICSWIVQSPLRQDHWLARSRYRHHLHFHHSPANHYIHMYNIYIYTGYHKTIVQLVYVI